MYPATFDYVRAGSVAEAIDLLVRHGGEGKLLAGGHSLLPLLKLRLAEPKVLIDVGRLPELGGIRVEGGAVLVGAATRHAEVARSAQIGRHLPALAEAAAGIGDLQVRNRGTIGGSLAHADPAADLPAVAVALGAELLIAGPAGQRVVAADDFFVGPLTTTLGPDEILTAVRFPLPPARAGSAYVKIRHPASGYAVAGCAAMVALDDAGACRQVRVVLCGVGPKPARADKTEELLVGKAPDPAAIATAAAAASDGLGAWADLAGSAEYRRHLAQVCARRALTAAVERS